MGHYIAMNRFKITIGRESDFENIWKNRDTYLNDVTDGGETQWLYQEKQIQPKKGLTVLWPTDFTHTHRGVVSPTQSKTIATGWYNYLDVRSIMV